MALLRPILGLQKLTIKHANARERSPENRTGAQGHCPRAKTLPVPRGWCWFKGGTSRRLSTEQRLPAKQLESRTAIISRMKSV